MDVFTLTPSEFLSKNEIEAARLASSGELNVQHQQRVSWPPSSVVALAYVDQLTRNRAIQPASADAIRATLERADRVRNSRQRGAAGVVSQLDALAAQVDRDAKGATGRDATRLQALATTLRGRAAQMR